MLASIHRDEVRRLMEQGAVLIEVLPEKEYREEHLPGAINIPLKRLDRLSTAHLTKDAPIIVYCYDDQ